MAQIINPENKYWHYKVDKDWSTARDAVASDSIIAGNETNERVGLYSGYEIHRTYLIFDITTVTTPVNNAKLYVRANTSVNKPSPTIYAAYGGNNPKGITSDYSLYLDNLSKTGDPLSTIPILSRGEWYSGLLDINVYPIDPADSLYVIGLVTEPDFTNAVDGTENGIVGISAYLSINETAGYPNAVMGTAGANISTVSGIPSANISKVMGV
jgi:hypothetical protein